MKTSILVYITHSPYFIYPISYILYPVFCNLTKYKLSPVSCTQNLLILSCIMLTINFTLYPKYSIMLTINFTLYPKYSMMYPINCKLYPVYPPCVYLSNIKSKSLERREISLYCQKFFYFSCYWIYTLSPSFFPLNG